MEAGVWDILFTRHELNFRQLSPSALYSPLRLMPARGTSFSLLRQRKEAKKGDCGHRFGSAKLPSLHAVFRAGSQLAAAPLRTCKPLFPEKPHSVRLRQQRKCSCNHSCQIFYASLSRKFNDECSLFVWHNQPHIAAMAAFFPP